MTLLSPPIARSFQLDCFCSTHVCNPNTTAQSPPSLSHFSPKTIKETNLFFHPGQQDCALATQKAALQTPSGSGQVCQRRLSCGMFMPIFPWECRGEFKNGNFCYDASDFFLIGKLESRYNVHLRVG
ncbi:hypothetical protein SLEP1_g47383 [Rubroshorea leprosula]|uniref:Uncharacterized protein n=1 Tax=Rubroshorea leprosula TaxID=152421 RepID=A0AAV5LQA4_9ROSI|nr:hypothetical protein SLEP1_g47383 [Rubroshorea leprosula]